MALGSGHPGDREAPGGLPEVPEHMRPGWMGNEGWFEMGWQDRLRDVAELLRETSSYTDDPQAAVMAYARRVRRMMPAERVVAVSRRGMTPPFYRVTRNTAWAEQPDPWKEQHKLPVRQGGLLGELLYAGEPRLILDANILPNDPSHEFLGGMRSIAALPTWDEGQALNMTLQVSSRPNAFKPEQFPELLWISNLFGRATKNLVLGRQVKEALAALDRELKVVGDIQLSLLPREAPNLPTLDISTHYQTSQRAGGDYYDFFDLSGCASAKESGRCTGLVVADVSGHGTPAAVLMAILHAIAHMIPGDPFPPHKGLEFVNRELTKRYTKDSGAFVTAIFGVWDERERTLHFSNAGHPPPLVRERDGRVWAAPIEGAGVPLGIIEDAEYSTQSIRFEPGQAFVLYTDGITEAFNASKDMYGDARLHEAIRRGGQGDAGGMAGGMASGILASILEDVGAFAGLTNRSDDRTLLVAAVR